MKFWHSFFNFLLLILSFTLFILYFSPDIQITLSHFIENTFQHSIRIPLNEWFKIHSIPPLEIWLKKQSLLFAFIFLILFCFSFCVQKNFTFKTNPLFKLLPFYHFVLQHRWTFFIAFSILMSVYGRQLYVLNGRSDAEVFINNNPSVPGQFYLGRYGDYFTRLLFEGGDFNPYYSAVLAFCFLLFSLILFASICQKIGKLSPAFSSALFCLFLIHPVWLEQFYFNQQILEVLFALFLIFLLFHFIYKITLTPPPAKINYFAF